MIEIRSEKPEDIDSIREVNTSAFKQPNEADLVDKLRKNCNNFISLVAEVDDQIVGHILFTPVTIETKNGVIDGMGLAPMAVLPDFQKKGIGARLIEKGIEELKKSNCPFVIVLGHPEYYPKFGFKAASRYGIRSTWEVPDEAFMILKLMDVDLSNYVGVARYRREFDEA